MPRHCSAGGCKSRDNRETRNVGITFHKLPKETTRRNLWISNSHRTNSWDPKTDFVYFCSKHFTPESFELTGCSGIRRLKEDAFPTVFYASSATKSRGQGTTLKQDDRKDPHLGEQETKKSETSAGGQRSVAEPTKANESEPASAEETAEVDQPLHQQHNSSVPPISRAISPSCYMRRLPPPPGFYLPKEHSYAQLCPLLWRRRYDQAIDCLERALRQLHAARRRENRLRSTVLRLRDKRLKHSLLLSKNRGGWTLMGESRQGKEGFNREGGDDAKCEDTGLFENRCGDQTELGRFFPDTNIWSEEKGYCFYCGRGQVQGGGQLSHRVSKPGKDVDTSVHMDSVKGLSSTSETSRDTQTETSEGQPGNTVDKSVTNVTHSQVMLQSMQHVIPATVSLPDSMEINLPFLTSQPELLLSDMCEEESTGQEHDQDLEQQLFWIQGDAQAQVFLLPLPAEEGLPSFLKMEGVTDDKQTVLVSELDLKQDLGLKTGNSGGPSTVENIFDDKKSSQHLVINRTQLEMKEDVREKLKEHLEGFHLQLSTEFPN
ncbi:THAP domain-containing protein 7 [Aulostomus maculatus]